MTSLSTGCLKGALTTPCLNDITALFKEGGMPWLGGEPARVGVTNIGTRYDCSISPSHSTWAEGEEPRSITAIGIGDHPALRAWLVASALGRWGPRADAMIVPSRLPLESQLSSVFKDQEQWEGLASALKEAKGEAVLLPPLCSLSDYNRYHELERMCGRKVLEAVTPLSAPGRRFLDILWSGAVQAGAELWAGRKVIELESRAEEVAAATVQGGLETRRLEVDAVLLATGGPLGDGLLLRHTALSDPFARFQVVSDQDSLRGGYASIDGRLLSSSGTEFANAFGAGDCLASAQRRWGQGLTEALQSAWDAVRAMEGL